MIYPLYYHGRSKTNSDKDFILRRMAVIPEQYQQRVADKYERIFRSRQTGFRKNANTYLHRVACWFRYRRNKKQEQSIEKIRKRTS
ncbi:hypothetical protein BA3_0043 [Thalassomonas phage BA3]|uniref:hypothetical protein n=1 Tax=Thalassomonas phage BA3 TaxID=469660 RepID=UPI00015D95BA|nr:hypothetical protein BA3_0043 [Thalassomonas phage BA3]ABV74328.1 hypothetical protein BA3_0043 [Thalassomonas phage BA3]